MSTIGARSESIQPNAPTSQCLCGTQRVGKTVTLAARFGPDSWASGTIRYMSVNQIEDVIAALDTIIQQAWEQNSRIGYFAALYRRVTHAVRDGLSSGSF